jgi:cyclic pyranopterin phosphate synthase
MRLIDSFGRQHDDLRVSVTDRCNLRCGYCMPAEPVWFPQSTLLRYEEIERLVRIAVDEGVRKVRLTGGEPLVRRDLVDLVRRLAAIEKLEDISLTTNGLLLDRFAQPLADAGLNRVNVSLDTLDPIRFAKLTRRDRLPSVLAGLSAATAAGLLPIKVNAVILRDVNEDDLLPLVGRARDEGWELRLIEFMPLENDGSWRSERVVTGAEVRSRIHAEWPLLESSADDDPHAPARRWQFADGLGSIGFIDSVSAPFCARCSRIRLTSDGLFRACLYDDVEVDLKTAMRGGATDEQLAEQMIHTLQRKGRGGALEIIERGEARPQSRTMHQIGG